MSSYSKREGLVLTLLITILIFVSLPLEPVTASSNFVNSEIENYVESHDTISPPIYSSSLRYGMDSTVDPCDDFYQYVNGGWRKVAELPKLSGNNTEFQNFAGINTAVTNVFKRLTFIIDSAVKLPGDIENVTLRTVATFYQSCLVTDSIDTDPFHRLRKTSAPIRDSSRNELCLQRVFQHVGGAAGQLFVEQLKSSSSAPRIDTILSAIMKQAMDRLASNKILSSEQKKKAAESLSRLKLRVGIPEHLMDYSELRLSKTNYLKNIEDAKSYSHLRWAKSIGSPPKDEWLYGLIRANANYIAEQHAIEIPPVWFFPPFFYENEEDALNFAAIGWVIGHEIYHSIARSIDMSVKGEITAAVDSFVMITSSLDTLDGWGTDGRRTFAEDIADMGGARAAYAAWQTYSGSSFSTKVKKGTGSIDGFTPDQRFFIAMGRFWRAKWRGTVVASAHAAPFARVNATVMQIPEFAKAFGCKAGDRMYIAPEKISKIW